MKLEGYFPRPMFNAISKIKAALILLMLGLWTPVWALECHDDRYLGNSYTVCSADLTRDDLRLFLYDEDGKPFGSFSAVNQSLSDQGLKLSFATNGGMYHDDRRPVGHYIERGRQIMRVVPNSGPGNFGLLPNGILCIGLNWVRVIETLRYQRESPNCAYASQSGPMLVIDGSLHPKFRAESTSRFIRNGVGASADHATAVFVISNNSVTFHEFASYFRDVLGLEQALYIDGNVSRLYAPSLGRADSGRRMGPIVGTVTPVQN
ncbi:MAG: phosphodiester glycosidase family protein [Rhodobacteraceae bacterium]|nr:phosphodiester glycosidase family protein [Paracoccaceae bacterium]